MLLPWVREHYIVIETFMQSYIVQNRFSPLKDVMMKKENIALLTKAMRVTNIGESYEA